MNRKERRSAEKKQRAGRGDAGEEISPVAPIVGAPEEPGVLLRIVAHVLLAQWVLKRVKHPQVLALLSEVARQAGRLDLISQIDKKTSERQ